MDVPGDERSAQYARAWAMIRSYFKQHGLVRHQLESYNYFMTSLLPHIVQEISTFEVRARDDKGERSDKKVECRAKQWVTICNVSVMRPTAKECDRFDESVSPHACRQRGLTYCASVLVDIVHDIARPGQKAERRVFREVLLAKIPVMVRSEFCTLSTGCGEENECPMDPGGYFIINGVEKVLLAQEKLHTNRDFIFASKPPSRVMYTCEIRSCHELKLRSTSTMKVDLSMGKMGVFPEIICHLPFIEMQLPLYAVFLLLGMKSKGEIIDLVFHNNVCTPAERHLLSGILDSSDRLYSTRDEVIDWIGRDGTRESTREKRVRYLDHILTNEMLPHIGLSREDAVLKLKGLFLGRMVRKLLRTYIDPATYPCDDRDDYANKRIDSAGMLMSLQFRQLFRNFVKSLQTQLSRLAESDKLEVTNVGDIINHKRISTGFKYAFSTGNWGMTKVKTTAQSGVAQMLSRTTLLSAIASMRRINTPINREGKAPKPRMLHHTSWGIVCPAETPEGGSCGLVKNLAIMAHVRVGTPSSYLLKHLDTDERASRLLENVWTSHTRSTAVMVNGILHAYVAFEKETELVELLRSQRRDGALPFDLTVTLSDRNVYIDSDAGCLCRPLFLVERLHMVASVFADGDGDSLWDRCVSAGIVEYLDKSEEAQMHVALDPRDLRDKRFTHMEIDPSLINGVCAALIPFSNHNQAPRNTYQSAMCKQAVGVYALNFQRRMDTIAHVLCYPQRPVVSTRMEEVVGTQRMPAGNNPIVCIMCYSGFNQEDSLLVNEQALQRGMFRSVVYRTCKDEERSGTDAEKFERPDPTTCSGIRAANYSNIGPNGLVKPGTRVQSGDVIIGKTIFTSDLGESRKVVKRDKSLIMRSEPATVDAVMTSTTREGHKYVKVRTRSFRQPVVGDKLSSRHGQKGVIGMVLAQEDMPYTADGVTPDIIVNPHAIPSRMTIGQLMETLLGKVGAVRMAFGDGTPFRDASIESIADELESFGYQRYGSERLYNGLSGELMPGHVFIGPTYYQRLKHMVIDKEHARARGPVQVLTRQPVEGRSRDGGLRFGEMERDCIISHGCSQVLRERLFEQSDPCIVDACRVCGLICIPSMETSNAPKKSPRCKQCGGSADTICSLRIPYAFKLLAQELMAMNIAPRLRMST